MCPIASNYVNLETVTPKRTTATRPKRAVATVRISKSRPDETSTETQDERIRAHVDGQGWVLVTDPFVDDGRSAYKQSRSTRPGLRAAMQIVEAGGADVFVCWKIDRVARNTRDLLNFVHELQRHGCDFVSVTENFDTSTALGRAMLGIIAVLAELESAQKSERIEVWQDRRRLTGSTPTGPRPFGYRRERNELHQIESEAEAIRDAAARVLAGESLRSVLARLNAAGGKNGTPFTMRGLRSILTGPTIAGLRLLEGTVQDGTFAPSDQWRPILDRQTWDAVRVVLLDPARRTSPGNGRRWLLPGLLECGRPGCGQPMRVKSSHPRGPRYQCPTGHNSIPVADTDRVVETLILDNLDPAAWRRLRSRGTRHIDTTELEGQLADLVEQFERDEIGYDEWKRMRAALVARLEDAASQPVELPNVDDPVRAWPGLDIDARRLLVAAVLPRIVIAPATPGLSHFDEVRIIVPLTADQGDEDQPAA